MGHALKRLSSLRIPEDEFNIYGSFSAYAHVTVRHSCSNSTKARAPNRPQLSIPRLLSNGYGGLSLGVKRPEREAVLFTFTYCRVHEAPSYVFLAWCLSH
jgi:hypothetical protein